MRVAVLGAGGTIAPAIVRDLAESEEVTAMRLLDLDLRRAESVAMEHGGGKAQARQADAKEGLAEQLAGMEVVVNSAAYRINLAAMEACLDAGCHYMDLGGLYHVTKQQLELSGRFEQRQNDQARYSVQQQSCASLAGASADRCNSELRTTIEADKLRNQAIDAGQSRSR